ncbi:transglycosylase SLT domain-containing protein [Rhizohabitans arisaemae]|uniref:aggregation-promoting factor C-terminal-like domain-containing protein n=1 Tax=Rhizohabitans arisaemae TaxID=2720610 RepID=UPI0024B18BF5|nr:transglycosylase SLT domain-containing protein [Rhizohabitans arisaemae]
MSARRRQESRRGEDHGYPVVRKPGWSMARKISMGLGLAGVAALAVVTTITAIENENRPPTKELAFTPEDMARILDDPFSADPKIDTLKAAAVQAYRADQLKSGRDQRPFDLVDRPEPPKKEGESGFPIPNVPPGPPPDPGSNKGIGKAMNAAQGWDGEWGCLEKLWTKESGWNHRAQNRYSGAYGIPQALPGRKMASAGADWMTNPATQIKWGLGYIKGRYGSPCKAWGFFLSKNWY